MKATANNTTTTATREAKPVCTPNIVRNVSTICSKGAKSATEKAAEAASKEAEKAAKAAAKAAEKAAKEAAKAAEKAKRDEYNTLKGEVVAKTKSLSSALKTYHGSENDILSNGLTVKAFMESLGFTYERGHISPKTFMSCIQKACPSMVIDGKIQHFVAHKATQRLEDLDAKPKSIHFWDKDKKAFKAVTLYSVEEVTEFESDDIFALLELASKFKEKKEKYAKANKAFKAAKGGFYVRTSTKSALKDDKGMATTHYVSVSVDSVNFPEVNL